MESVNVLFLWKVPVWLKQYFQGKFGSVTGLNLIFPVDATESELLELAPTAQIIVGWRPSQKLLESAQKLILFINPGAGIQHLLELFRGLDPVRGVILVNGHGNSYFVAQHAVALLLALMNKIIPHHNWMVEGKWRKGDTDAKTLPLRKRKVGLLGYGAINQQVHRFLSGFDVDFVILRRNWENTSEAFPTPVQKYNPSQLHEFLTIIDTLIVAIPLTTETKGLLRIDELRLLGPQGLLVNVARGAVIEQNALYHALAEKIIAGAAIDVWYTYKPEPDDAGQQHPFEYPFHKLNNVVLSPHRAASPFDDLHRWDEVIENIQRFIKGRRDFLNVVDLEKGY